MLDDAGWMIEAGDSVAAQPSKSELKVLWMARKNSVTVVASNKSVSVARGSARSNTPIEIVLLGHILLPGAISEQYLPTQIVNGDLIPHEGKMTDEERELRELLV